MTDLQIISSLFAIAAMGVAGLWALFAFYDKKQNSRIMIDREISLKITEMQVQILRIEKDVEEMRKKHECDYVDLKREFLTNIREFKDTNAEVNRKIINQLYDMNNLLVRLDERFENHINPHK